MDNKKQPRKCCSKLKCTGTAELERAIAVDLEQQDKALLEFLDDTEKKDCSK